MFLNYDRFKMNGYWGAHIRLTVAMIKTTLKARLNFKSPKRRPRTNAAPD